MHSTIYTIHGHNDAKVQAVMVEMAKLGAPLIRVVDLGDHYMAIEGTHRLEAACRLGIAPELIVLEPSEMVEADSLDVDNLQAGASYTADEVAGELESQGSGCYRIEYDGTLTLVFNGKFIPNYA